MKNNYCWYLVNAENQVLGRFASKIANLLIGKHKINYLPNLNVGDYVIVINANKIITTGNKYKDKIYYKHTGYVGNLKKITFKDVFIKNPRYIILHAVSGMLPRNSLKKVMIRKLKIYLDNNHRHISQKPKIFNL
ncbi:MAG: 50S ribosomal protein L13 [Candidatus Lightella neohaematopini]|nr:50S ribosomal protein L13 [Candidatus Lightella neohaematopini]MCV2528891.1 50S ribosomal protein L13 [Candidatus Lightella neohaematopini]